MSTLQRIVNIDSGFFARREPRKSAGFDKYFRHAMDGKINPHDSAQFSPAAIFLQKIKWRLISLKTTPEEKMQLHFLNDDLEFITEIDLPHFAAPGSQHLRVNDFFFNEGKKIQSTLLFSVDKQLVHLWDEYELKPMKAVKTFFDRAVSDSLHHGIPFAAIPEWNWYEGIKGEIDSELINILVGVTALAEKVLQIPIAKGKAVPEAKTVELERLIITEVIT